VLNLKDNFSLSLVWKKCNEVRISGSVCCETCCTSMLHDAFWAEGLETLASGSFCGPHQVGLFYIDSVVAESC
jgi:hypothetical protein